MTLDIDNPKFRAGFARLARITSAMSGVGSGVVGIAKKVGLGLQAAWTLVGLYLLPSVRNEIPANVRLVPAW
jgi:magnesium-protoporphyrin IX monomethyl ester (oxidative) cyclase